MQNGTARLPRCFTVMNSVTSMLVAPPAPTATYGKGERAKTGIKTRAMDSRNMLETKATEPVAPPSSRVRITPESEYHPKPEESARAVPTGMLARRPTTSPPSNDPATVPIGMRSSSGFRAGRKVIRRARPRTRYWGVLFVIIIVLFLNQSAFRLPPASRNVAVGVFGVALCSLGIAIAVWARMHLGRNWNVEPSIQEGHELVISGPYRFVRHPIYTGMLVAIFGSALVGGPPWFIAFIAACVLFVWRVKTEEKFMMELFPEQYPE